MIITNHAVARYLERVRPEGDRREAFNVLRDAVRRAVRTGRTWYGQAMWTVDNPDMRLISKHDPEVGMVLVTVLAPNEPWGERVETPPVPSSAPRVVVPPPVAVPTPRERALALHIQYTQGSAAKKERKRAHLEAEAAGKAKRVRHAAWVAALAAAGTDVVKRRAVHAAMMKGAAFPTAKKLRAVRNAACLADAAARRSAGLVRERTPDHSRCGHNGCANERPVSSVWTRAYDGASVCAACAATLDAVYEELKAA